MKGWSDVMQDMSGAATGPDVLHDQNDKLDQPPPPPPPPLTLSRNSEISVLELETVFAAMLIR